MDQVTIDYLTLNGGQGELASHIRSTGGVNVGYMRPWIGKDGRIKCTVYMGGDPKNPDNYRNMPFPIANPLQINSVLRRDEWKQLDEAVLEISRTRLNGVQSLVDRGLTYDLGNGMGTTVLEYHDVSDAMEADMTMDGVTRGQGDRPAFGTVYMPLPIIHADYEINARVLEASRKLGNPLDTTSAERASRKVSEKLESLLFTDVTYAYGGGTIYSYLNHPSRNTGSLTANWDASATTGADILNDVLAMKQASINAMHYGPWELYIPTAYETVLDDDYDTTTPGTTIRERIMKVSGILAIKVVDTLTANNVLLVEMRKDTVRLVRGLGVQNIEWKTEGGLITKYKVMTIQVPQIRADQDGNSGIIHFS